MYNMSIFRTRNNTGWRKSNPLPVLNYQYVVVNRIKAC